VVVVWGVWEQCAGVGLDSEASSFCCQVAVSRG